MLNYTNSTGRFTKISIIISALIIFLIQSCSVFQTEKNVSTFYYYDNNNKIFPKNINLISNLENDKLVFASDDSIYFIENKNLVSKHEIKAIKTIQELNGNYYAGTDYGFYMIDKSNKVSLISIPAITENPKITALLKKDNELWIGTEGVGIYRFDGKAVKPVPSTPVINCLAVTSDNSVWAGTNSGLFRFFTDGSSVRYSEEIPHEGIAILDNDVRHLQIDSHNNLWVFMVNAVSVFTTNQIFTKNSDHIEPYTIDYIGNDKNSVYKIFDFKNIEDKIVFSENGIYILSDVEVSEEHTHGDESSTNKTNPGNLKKIDYLKLEDGTVIKIDKALDCHYDEKNSLLLSIANGVYRIPQSVLKKL